MRPDVVATHGKLRVHVGAYSAVLALLALLSWLGHAWGYFIVYSVILVSFALVVGVVSLSLARSSPSKGNTRAAVFLQRSLRSFVYAQITLSAVLVAIAILARLTSGPLGLFPGGAFEGVPSEHPFEPGLVSQGDEIQMQIPTDPPYTITTHAFVIDDALYVGADFNFPFNRWVHTVQKSPAVLLRIDGRLFRRRAVRITDRSESRHLLEEVSRLRGHGVDDWLTDVWFFRMEHPR